MAFTSPPASGSYFRASALATLLEERTPVTASKSSTTGPRTSSTHAADPDLVLALPAGTWDVDLTMLVVSAANAAGDFSWRLAWTGDATVTQTQHGLVDTLASGGSGDIAALVATPDSSTPTSDLDAGASTTNTVVYGKARLVASTSVGLTLEWAQAASNASGTSLLAGSSMTARRAS